MFAVDVSGPHRGLKLKFKQILFCWNFLNSLVLFTRACHINISQLGVKFLHILFFVLLHTFQFFGGLRANPNRF